MCGMMGALIGAGASIAGSAMQAKAQQQNADAEYETRKRQMKIEIENERIKALSNINARMEEYLRQQATNRATVSAAGIFNLAYTNAIEPYNTRQAGRDMQDIHYESSQKVGNAKYNIGVARMNRDSAINASKATFMANAVGAIGSVFA